MLPIYWISYHYSNDHQRPRQFKKKYERLTKAIPVPQHCFHVYESDKVPADFKGDGFPAVKNMMTMVSHYETLVKARKEGYDHILILEDKVSLLDQNLFKDFLINFQPPTQPWDILFLGGYIEEHSIPEIDQEWVPGHSRSHFAYIINLKANVDLFPHNGEDWGRQLYLLENSFYRQPFLVTPQYYDFKKGLMKETAIGLSMAQIDESSDLREIKLKMNYIEEERLPRITLFSVLNNSRTWWPLLLMNLNNLDYVTQKMEWIILDLSQDPGETIEDLLPQKRGKEGSWHLKYFHQPDWKSLNYLELVEKLKDEISHDYVLELAPKIFYPVFSIHSRVKTALKYPKIGYFGATEVQMYHIPNDQTYLIGRNQNLEFVEGTRLICLNRKLDQKMRIPGQFVSRTLDYLDHSDQELYQEEDKFPDYLETEEFFSDLILIIDDLRKEYQRKGQL